MSPSPFLKFRALMAKMDSKGTLGQGWWDILRTLAYSATLLLLSAASRAILVTSKGGRSGVGGSAKRISAVGPPFAPPLCPLSHLSFGPLPFVLTPPPGIHPRRCGKMGEASSGIS